MNFSPKKYGRFLKWTYPQLSSIYRWIFHYISTIFGVATFSETPISKNDRNSSRFPPATASVVKRLNRPWQVAPGQAEQGRDEGRRWLVLQIPLNNYNSTRIIIRARLATLGGN